MFVDANRTFWQLMNRPAAGRLRVQKSRRVTMDFVGISDVLAATLCAFLPGVLLHGNIDNNVVFFSILQGALLRSLLVYWFLRHFDFYNLAKLSALPHWTDLPKMALAICLACMATSGLGISFQVGSPQFYSWFVVYGVTCISMMLLGRLFAQRILQSAHHKRNFTTRLGIYGCGPIADEIIRNCSFPGDGIEFIGVFDDRREGDRTNASNCARAGNFEDLLQLGRTGMVDQIVIALPATADRRIADLAKRLEQLPVDLHVATHLVGNLVDETHSHQVSTLGDVGLLDIKRRPLADWGRHIKAFEDYGLSSAALLLALPVMLIVAVAIKLDSQGPVFFRQRRRGVNHSIIDVYKFRTMQVMEDGAHIRQAARDDERITRLGRFLRRSSLDELPQLVNVLRGEMSLIGPRPHAIAHDDIFVKQVERYANRHQIKPGITGWAQVNGFRGPTQTAADIEGRVACDMHYINNWSPWLDLKILCLTVIRGFVHKNAY
jgi:Undecaprenyl-phosphate glucose phosphotransferase